MWETICNKNTVQDEYGKQRSQQERQDTKDDRHTRPAGEGGSPPTYATRLTTWGKRTLLSTPQNNVASMRQDANAHPPA